LLYIFLLFLKEAKWRWHTAILVRNSYIITDINCYHYSSCTQSTSYRDKSRRNRHSQRRVYTFLGQRWWVYYWIAYQHLLDLPIVFVYVPPAPLVLPTRRYLSLLLSRLPSWTGSLSPPEHERTQPHLPSRMARPCKGAAWQVSHCVSDFSWVACKIDTRRDQGPGLRVACKRACTHALALLHLHSHCHFSLKARKRTLHAPLLGFSQFSE